MLDEEELLDYDETDEIPKTDDRLNSTKFSSAACGFEKFQLKPELLHAIRDCGFEQPSTVQSQVLPHAVLGTDILCQAPSGMGKTAVFIFASLQQLQPVDGQVSIIILCHGSELAFQINQEYHRFCKYLSDVKISIFTGGPPIINDERTLKNNCPHVVVGTPGRILALTRTAALDLSNVKHFIIDECDQVLAAFDMRRSIQEIFDSTAKDKQVMMFAATLSQQVRPTCAEFMREPMEILVDDESKLINHVSFIANVPCLRSILDTMLACIFMLMKNIQQHYVKSSEKRKHQKLVQLLDLLEFYQIVIFVNSEIRCNALCKFLTEQNFPTCQIRRGMAREERLACYRKFKWFEERILVATDLFARGIDVDRINVVINYDTPEETDTYLHRMARTGRFGGKGLAISLVSSKSDAVALNKAQCRFKVHITKLPDKVEPATYLDHHR